MRGDLLFYRGDARNLVHRLIVWRTHGPMVHVEVDLGDGTAIGAEGFKGVTRHPLNDNCVRVTLDTSSDRINAGIVWLRSHVGDPYGWADILDWIVTLFVPHSPIVQQQHGFDCSDLVARYVEIAGGVKLGSLTDDFALISPNDLARACGVL